MKYNNKSQLRREILKKRNAISKEEKCLWDRQILGRLMAYEEENPCDILLCYVDYKSEVSTKEFLKWCIDKEKKVFVPKVRIGEKPDSSEKEFAMEFYRLESLEQLKEGYQGILEPEGRHQDAFSCFVAEQEPIRMFLPGAVFDRQGNRIGYGSGFYDRWLAKWDRQEILDSDEKCRPEKESKPGKKYRLEEEEKLEKIYRLEKESKPEKKYRPDEEEKPGEIYRLEKKDIRKKKYTLEKIGLAYELQVVSEILTEDFDKKADFIITEKQIIKCH